jgi:hypothetical protein
MRAIALLVSLDKRKPRGINLRVFLDSTWWRLRLKE